MNLNLKQGHVSHQDVDHHEVWEYMKCNFNTKVMNIFVNSKHNIIGIISLGECSILWL